jgi:tetratricopeptide (TPR) repeat protein
MASSPAFSRDKANTARMDKQRQLLFWNEKTFGEHHPTLIANRINLAVDLEKLGEYVDAEKEFEQFVVAANKAFGQDHPATLNVTNGLGLVLLRQGKYKEAEKMLRGVLEICTKLFREDN